MGATYYSISGQYKQALESWDTTFGSVKKLSTADSLKFTKLIPVNAQDYILEKADHEKVIIINEAPHNASHLTDIIEIITSKDNRFLILDKGNYDIVMKDKEYKIINRFEKTIR
ncbi:hypothetical protein [Chryseobacterium viscerum]|uniref:Uncharacterized protein n=1 Tax=Chryseobacterium viscerum TaxID=1037377 RepID=A0A316WJY1_9FLAO|nr:hypothetical protein [Chryseobacterium viscerum]PWN61722.1 hypothetical protein C1634_010635 [Chryseobacterium viscerum]